MQSEHGSLRVIETAVVSATDTLACSSFSQFVEDEGTVVFFKNAFGLAAVRPVFPDSTDSGVEVDK